MKTAREALLALAAEFERELDVIPETESATRLAWRQAASMARVAAQAPEVVQNHPHDIAGDPEIAIACPTCSAPVGDTCEGYGYCPARSAATNWAVTMPRKVAR